MFGNIFRKYILSSFRSKDLVIWTLAFPILLSTLFYFAFSSLEEGTVLGTVPVGIVEDEAFQSEKAFQIMLDSMTEGEDPFLEIHYTEDEEQAEALLKEGEIDGYVRIQEGTPALFVKDSGISQTVLKNILDRYIQTKDGMTAILADNPKALGKMIKSGGDLFVENDVSVKEISFSGNNPSATVNYFYSLLAMVCLFGAFHGQVIIMTMQANLSPLGARKTASPQSRGTIFGASFLGALLVQFFCTALALCYIQFVLKVDFGRQFWYALLVCFVGSLVGISFGCVISLPSRWKQGMKQSVMIVFSLGCSFLAGLMVSGVNYVVQKNAPVVSMLNPAARIADAFYCLYYYDNYDRYFQNIGILVVMATVMFAVSVICSRRKAYESI